MCDNIPLRQLSLVNIASRYSETLIVHLLRLKNIVPISEYQYDLELILTFDGVIR